MNKYDGYVNASLPDHSTFGVVFNMNRQVFDQSNYCEGDPAANENTHKAILNENFRKALRAAYDVKAYNMVTSPESIALSMIRNIDNDSNIVRTSDGKNYVVTSGLTVGDIIVAKGAGYVKEGQEIISAK
jgi:oligopeptide transport system substrate-binding protein